MFVVGLSRCIGSILGVLLRLAPALKTQVKNVLVLVDEPRHSLGYVASVDIKLRSSCTFARRQHCLR